MSFISQVAWMQCSFLIKEKITLQWRRGRHHLSQSFSVDSTNHGTGWCQWPSKDAVRTRNFSAVLCLVTQSCLTLCNPMDCSPPGSSVHGISRQKSWSRLPFPTPGSSRPRDQTWVSCIAGRFFTVWTKTFKPNVSTCILPFPICHNCRMNQVTLNHKDWVLPSYLLHNLDSSQERGECYKDNFFFPLVITYRFQGSHHLLHPLYLTSYVLTISLYENM